MRILWLPGWFPSRVDFLNGDFIERHAKAISELADITVLYVIKDTQLQTAKSEIVKEQYGNLTVYRGYYKGKDGGSVFNKIGSVIQHHRLLFRLYYNLRKKSNSFDLCHVHIVLRQSLLALWLKWRFKMKYAVSEQNGWYMPGDRRFFRQNFLFRWFVKKIFNNAAALHVVSNSLGIELKKAGLFTRPYSVIPNVVNTNVFKQASDVNSKDAIGFIAITGDTRHKNTDGIIRSFTAFLKKGYKATLHIAGPNIEDLKQLVQINGVEDNVVFYGAVSNEKVASITQLSDAMIFFTRYETFGCVMAEAMCCGLPVIASRLPVLEENLKEGVDALFVESEDEKGLTEKLIEFAQNRQQFNNDLIAANAKDKYNYHRVALQFMELYQKVLAKED